jgi:hypothetical protein
MGTIAEKLSYLNTTKEKIRDSINLTGANIGTNDTFRSYASKLKKGYIDIINNGIDNLYNNFPKVSGIGSNLSLTPTYEAPIKLNEIQGNTLQDGTPTPDTPIPIENVTGLQKVNVCGKNLFDENYENISSALIYKPFYVGNGTFTLSTTTPLNTSNNANLFFLSGNVSTGASTSSNGVYINNSRQVQSVNGYVTIAYRNLQSVDPTDYNTQLEKGSTATTYEAYSGNTYEVNLGKNLISSITKFGNTLKFNGAIENENYIFKAGTYTIKYTRNISSTISTFIKDTTGTQTSLGAETTITFTSNYDFNIWFYRSGITTDDVSEVQLEKGSQATSYSPYFTPIELNKINTYQDSIKKSSGKNLCTGVRKSSSNNDLFFDFDKNIYQTITLSATLNSQTQGNSIYLSVDGVSKGKVGEMTGTANTKQTTTITFTNEMYEAIQNSTTCFLQLYRNNAGFVIPNDGQINNGSTALPYEPYGKVWYVEKQIGKVVLDISLSSVGSTNFSNLYQIYANVMNISYLIGGFCDNFKFNDNNRIIDNNNANNYLSDNQCALRLGNESARDRFYVKSTNFASANELKAYFNTNPTTLYYVLATPEYTEITNTELIEDLETLYTTKSQEGTTNISITSENLPMILNASALKNEE